MIYVAQYPPKAAPIATQKDSSPCMSARSYLIEKILTVSSKLIVLKYAKQ